MNLYQLIRREEGLNIWQVLTLASCVSFLFTFVFGIGLIVSHCEELFGGAKQVALVSVEDPLSGAANQLDRRDVAIDCTTTEIPGLVSTLPSFVVSATPVGTDGAFAVLTQSTEEPESETSVISIPISTQTHTQTIYTVRPRPEPSNTTTTLVVASEIPFCSNVISTVTITYTVIPTASSSIYPSWLSSSVLGDITVTAGASTVTNVNTEVSFTTDLPDVTATGNPSTLTNVQTDVSLTTDLPDVTVSGNPTTVTNVQTDVSLTSDLPDATVSGNPSTVTDLRTKTALITYPNGQISTTIVMTDLWTVPEPSLVTVTEFSTVKTTITTVHPPPVVVTVTSYPSPSDSSVDTTVTEVLTTTNADPLTLTTTVWTTPVVVSHSYSHSHSYSYPAGNRTVETGASGTASSTGTPTTPAVVVISAGTKQSEMTSRPGQLGCFMIIVAAIMFAL
ncbi:hypothetical protein ESCO_000685 [Escovopsis weberi]|uniref:Uncharacterized protein n=1 Tax=Escovopsis weberi TaxID=150374 RepID=A0A0M8MWV5_ESCWE|nr:hypothetical protein ESCO_000685 [Escovopsis weberi]